MPNKNLKIFLVILAFLLAGTLFCFIFYKADQKEGLREKNVAPAGLMKVKLIINSGASNVYESSINEGSTVFDLLKKIDSEKKLNLKYQESSMGVFVEEIQGVKNNAGKNEYWLYKVNGKVANMGASLYKLKDNDEVEWFFGPVKDFNF